nr:RNA methyltransferase [Desulfobulbaceae bacterium]
MKVDVALIHYPVCNRNNELIGSAVTNLDLHDIARASRTYGVDTFYVVTPFADQQKLVQEIIDHWQTGHGSRHNPDRKEAFSLIQLVDDVEQLFAVTQEKWGTKPLILATSAREMPNRHGYDEVKERLQRDEPVLLLFGTASGMSVELFDHVDAVLPPLGGVGSYNHLSVRSAVSIILDRLLGV